MHRHPRHDAARAQRGLSLIEALMGLAVTLVAAGFSLQGLGHALDTRRLEAAAAQWRTDLQLARSEAIARNDNLRISFKHAGAGSCYIVHTGSASACHCNAQGQAVCQAGATPLRSQVFAADGRVQLQSNVASMVLDPHTGTVSPGGTVRWLAADGRAIHGVVNIMGRARLCSPGAAVPGYKAC